MTSEGEPDLATSKINQAMDAVAVATETVRQTTQSFADAIDASRQPGAPLDRLAHWTREAPIQTLAVAFLIGFMVARRRG